MQLCGYMQIIFVTQRMHCRPFVRRLLYMAGPRGDIERIACDGLHGTLARKGAIGSRLNPPTIGMPIDGMESS